MTESDDVCGWPTADDAACQNPATEDDGRCWIPSHGDFGADNKLGRDTKFNADRAERALEAARRGKSMAGCARAAGVSKSTFHDWVHTDYEYDSEPFRNAYTRARAQGENRILEQALDGDIDTSFAKFLLATSFDYVKTERREHAVDTDADLDTQATAEFVTYESDTDSE